jgi:hypothetical protein
MGAPAPSPYYVAAEMGLAPLPAATALAIGRPARGQQASVNSPGGFGRSNNPNIGSNAGDVFGLNPGQDDNNNNNNDGDDSGRWDQALDELVDLGGNQGPEDQEMDDVQGAEE